MNTLLLILALLARDESPFPCLEKDPWMGFAPGSTVTRRYRVNQEAGDQIITVKSIDKDAITLEARTLEKAEEVPWKFTPFTRQIGDEAKATGKQTKLYAVGPRKVQALLREYTGGGLGGGVRVAFADEFPGGIVEVSVRGESSGSYAFKAIEKLKVDGQDVECFRYDLSIGDGKKKVEGQFWLSSKVPGTIVKFLLRETDGKNTRETYAEVLKFETKK
jgi:hypothetical protein